MKKLIYMLFLLCFAQGVKAQDIDILCLTCDTVKTHMSPTTIVDVYMIYPIYSNKSDTTKLKQLQFTNVFQRVTRNQTLQYMLNVEEVKAFIQLYGEKYLHVEGFNYFLAFSEGKYGMIRVNGDGTFNDDSWMSLYTQIPLTSNHFLVFVKRLGQNKIITRP